MNFEELKQEFIDFLLERGISATEDSCKEKLTALLEAHSEQVEQDKWKPYPENVPETNKDYWIHTKMGNERLEGSQYFTSDVIAFQELPKPYKQPKK